MSPPIAPIHSLAGQRVFRAQVWQWEQEGTQHTRGKEEQKGTPHPSPGSLQLIWRNRDVWPSKNRMSRGAQTHPGLGEEEGLVWSQLLSLPR